MHYINGTGYVESSGAKVCSKREMALRLARVHGYNNDTSAFTRLLIESSVARVSLNAAWQAGVNMRKGGAQ